MSKLEFIMKDLESFYICHIDATTKAAHIGVNGKVVANEQSITHFSVKPYEELAENPEPFETWSKKLIPYLPLIMKA